MKTPPTSRTAEDGNALAGMPTRGRAGAVRATQTTLATLMRQPDGSLAEPTITVVMDAYSRTILGMHVS